jgi:hypothetical protein
MSIAEGPVQQANSDFEKDLREEIKRQSQGDK